MKKNQTLLFRHPYVLVQIIATLFGCVKRTLQKVMSCMHNTWN